MVVLTQGIHDTIVAYDGIISKFAITKIASDKIVDTDGAGDAFCGGFMSQFVQGRPIKQCVAAGHYLAHVVIQETGTSFPPRKHSFDYSD
jgi:adenosine kinase